MNTARFAHGAAGSATSALAYQGSIPGGNTQAVEEWSQGTTVRSVDTD